mgnify:CR=1 FL=1
MSLFHRPAGAGGIALDAGHDLRDPVAATLRTTGNTVLKAANLLIVVGILRSGGDTRFSLAIDTGPMWLIGIPLAMLGAFVLHLPVYFVVMLVILGDELTKFLLGMWRVRSGRWLRDVVTALS